MTDALAAAVRRLNGLLGRELGRNLYGDPLFSWRNSDQCVWPAFRTGRLVSRPRDTVIPILGQSEPERVVLEEVVPEYATSRQMRLENVWVVVKWLSPEELIWGWIGRHGGEAVTVTPHPSDAQLRELWDRQFPGASFPAQGHTVPTDAYLPRWLGGDREPNERDTLWFIAQVKEQTRLTFDVRLNHMLECEDAVEADKRRVIEDQVRDSFGAFLNPTPGKRSSFVSLPWTRKDRLS